MNIFYNKKICLKKLIFSMVEEKIITNTFEDKTWEDNIIEICKSTLPQDWNQRKIKTCFRGRIRKVRAIGSATSYKKISEEVRSERKILFYIVKWLFKFWKPFANQAQKNLLHFICKKWIIDIK